MQTAKALVLLLFTLVLIAAPDPLASAAGRNASPVVVELFTSEACSSCPPADALLTKLDRQHEVNGAEVLVLGEHVDYFNSSGWADRFSSAKFSERQNDYARRFQLPSAYTPQMVIDGNSEALGSDPAAVEQKIGLAARIPKMVTVDLSWTAQRSLHVSVKGASGEPSAVLLAITENGLTTSVAAGENSGRVLQHSGVVRELRQLGTISGGGFVTSAPIVPARDWKRPNLRVVVFVQRLRNGEFIGAATVMFP